MTYKPDYFARAPKWATLALAPKANGDRTGTEPIVYAMCTRAGAWVSPEGPAYNPADWVVVAFRLPSIFSTDHGPKNTPEVPGEFQDESVNDIWCPLLWACLLYSNIWLIAYGALTGEKLFYWLGVPLAAVSASGLVKYLISVIRGER